MKFFKPVSELGKALAMVEMGTSRDPEKMKNVMENMLHMVPLIHG